MEIRVLRYFLAVVKEQTVSGAAASLHLTQPTLSRQLKELEEELGKKLFVRGSHKIELTEEGMLLRKRAEQILELVSRTESDISSSSESLAGDIYIGAGETDAIKLIARAASKMRRDHPLVHFHIYSADGADVTERLDKGLIDFGVVFTPVDAGKHNIIKIPFRDEWGILMRRDSELAAHTAIKAADVRKLPLIISRQIADKAPVIKWFGTRLESLDVVSTYNLVYNASMMVRENIGYALTLDKLINVSGDSELCFRRLDPPVYAELHFIWDRYQILTRSAQRFIEYVRAEIEEAGSEIPQNI